ncbi:MAG TPA: aminotransferase class I/II-fold pyridoxal phosphate-dependent enzyme [Pirellulales bacterium]
MASRPDDICPAPAAVSKQPTEPLVAPIFASSVYICGDPLQAEAMLAGKIPGHVYRRDGHPNAEILAEKCRQLHGAPRAAITASGMAATALALVSQCRQGDHVVLSNQMYGRSLLLLSDEAERLGIAATVVDTCDLGGTTAAFRPNTKLLVVETITNPLLRVSDIRSLAEIAHRRGALLLVDNTFASPVLCRPLEFGADLVLESLTKIMNGHSDVMLGALCGREENWQRVPNVLSTWGWSAAPWDCWLATRGIGTLHLRVERASQNALAAARFLAQQATVDVVHYPGLETHPNHALAERQFGGRFGSMVSFTLGGGTTAAERFIKSAKQIPFCPSLGELSTTLTHPESTSHRAMTPAARNALGIKGGTIRLSVGTESIEFVISALSEGLSGK